MTRATTPKLPAQPLRDLDPDSVLRLIGAAGDLALVLDGIGTVLDVLSNDRELIKAVARDWHGRAWADTVTVESRDKVAELLRDAQAGELAAARWRQVNHPVKGSADLVMSYAVVRIVDDARTPAKRRLVAIGRDLRGNVELQQRLVEAQQSMERDYWRFREAETRYRNLFQSSAEAVLIVDGASLKVVEANPAALALCGAKVKPVGAALISLFGAAAAGPLQALLAAARSVGKHEPLTVPLTASGIAVVVSATLFRQEQAAFLLIRLAPAPVASSRAKRGQSAAPASGDAAMAGSATMLAAFLRSAADGLVFTDAQGRIVVANPAFAGLAQLSTEEQARGEPLDRWLGRTGVEIGVLISHLRDRGTVGLYTTELRGELGAASEVEISASRLDPSGDAQYAFAVRDIGRRLRPDERTLPKVPQSVKQLTELVGRVPLKDIVAETSELIEKLSIETALQMTRDNRALAAQMLGLSRQSLYVKLRRYGLGDLPDAANE
jgi:transcriptional regulator PpsR